jgi:hypothetical protein
MATIIPITTNTTIATCVQIQNGDIARTAYFGRTGGIPFFAPMGQTSSSR